MQLFLQYYSWTKALKKNKKHFDLMMAQAEDHKSYYESSWEENNCVVKI